MSSPSANRYLTWVHRYRWWIIATTLMLAGISAALAATRLTIATDLAALLPSDSQAVRDMRELERRVPAQGNVVTLVISDNPSLRQQVVDDLAAAYRKIDPRLVSRVEDDDREVREFARANMHLFVSLDTLIKARDNLRERIQQAKLRENPLYIDLEDDGGSDEAAGEEDPFQSLRSERDRVFAKLDHSTFVSDEAQIQIVVIRAAFAKTNVGLAEQLAREIERVRGEALAVPGRSQVEIGSGGAVLDAVVERDAVVRSMALAVAITALLVFSLLAAFYCSASVVLMLAASLVVGVTITFGVTALAIGHLNVATSFLIAIVAGNGVNYGLLMLARYAEERARRGMTPEQALAVALPSTLRPTLVACLGAMIAYGSLSVTSFRGFSEFALIGSVGMALCWLSAYIFLPAIVLVSDRRRNVEPTRQVAGRFLARLFSIPAPAVTYGSALAISIAAFGVAYGYVANDPFEYDVQKLRSSHDDPSKRYKDLSDRYFGKAVAGSSTYIAAASAEQVPMVVDALRDVDRNRQKSEKVFGRILSVESAIPRDQDRKLLVLSELRAMMLDENVLASLDEQDRKLLTELRPPEDLAPIERTSLPSSVAQSLEENDGTFGRIVSVRPAPNLEMWNGKDLIRFANAVRSLELADGSVVTTSGSSVVFADIVDAIRRDAPTAAIAAAIAITIMVLVVVGFNRMAVGVLLSTALGSLVMVAAVSLLGMKINFLDFVALPITIGLGVDYGINIAHRGFHAREGDRFASLRTSGVAVLVASGTTVIAYGSLLVSANSAVRSFGLASLIGEACCVIAAMALVPLFAARHAAAPSPSSASATPAT